MSDRLLDAKAVADKLGVPLSWVREATKSGAIPHVSLGKYKRYDLDDVDAWIASCKQPGRRWRSESMGPAGEELRGIRPGRPGTTLGVRGIRQTRSVDHA